MTGCGTHGHECATCGDRADAGTVVSLDGADAVVELGDGSRVDVAVDLISGVKTGTRVLVHQGVAICAAEGVAS